jgi:hypothetical protein
MIGPVFFEFIQRKRDEGFGEGNFTALFNRWSATRCAAARCRRSRRTAPRLSRIHHVAYRCKDAKETVEWYGACWA